jgi:5'-3' exonuclease
MKALIDADSIIYTIAFVEKSKTRCKKSFDDKLKEIINNLEADVGLVYIKGKDNFRYQVDSEYKGHRKQEFDPDVKERIDMLYEYANEHAIKSDGGEADDYVFIGAMDCIAEEEAYIVCCIDKDLQQIPGWQYNYRTSELKEITPEFAYRFTMKQFLTGDATDNIKGIAKIGPKTADKILDPIPMEQLWNTVIKTWQEKLPRNEWKEPFVKCANNIYIRRSLADLRPKTFEELEEDFKWIQDTGSGEEMTSTSQSTVDSSTSLDAPIQMNEDFISEESSSTLISERKEASEKVLGESI